MKLDDHRPVTAKLLVLYGARAGETVPVTGSPFLIGRSVGCDLRPGCPWANRKHCALIHTESGWMIRDLGSKHGTCVNNHTLHEDQLLTHGDQIYVGTEIYEVRFVEETADGRSLDRKMPLARGTGHFAPIDACRLLIYHDRKNKRSLAN